MESNSLLRRLEMYVMIYSIENDFVDNLSEQLLISDISSTLIDRSQNVKDKNNLTEVLRGLDLQGYIEIVNNNSLKLGVKIAEKSFINKVLTDIISIRNKVMHPRLFEYFDYPKLKECFNNIDNEISFFQWKNVLDARKMIRENPAGLLKYDVLLKKSSSVIENLPTIVDFDDTSFIGRRKEIGEIKEKLFKKNVHILSILGDGGIGKTATTIKLLYDLLDDEKNPFEVILWVSLKTKELNNYEFVNIANAIDNTSKMYDKLGEFVGGEANNVKQELIKISKEFSTLLVLDNLETINTVEIRDFLDEFSENGKVIITSRIGLGEMEHRYFMSGLSDSDLLSYVDTLLELYNKQNYLTNEEKMNYSKVELHSNPLAIKWFIRGLANGQTPLELLKNKSNLINFCMSNVYEKLSEQAKKIILILKCIRMDITFAEVVYLIGKDDYDEMETRAAINELCKCNFLDPEKFSLSEVLAITDFAQEFIKSSINEDAEKKGLIKQKLSALNAFDQSMIERRSRTPYSLQTFYYEYGERKKLVAAYYLSSAIEAQYKRDLDLAFDYIRLAKSLCPKYFECNKIEAYLLRNSNREKALEEYEIAKKNARTQKEQRLIWINYKEFCLSNNDYQGALNAIESAIIIEDEVLLQFEKVKILACIGEFDKAKEILARIESECIGNNRIENIYLTRKADIYKREAELERDYLKRFELLKKASETILRTEQLDRDSLEYLSLILQMMMTSYFDASIVQYVYKTLSAVDKNILKTKGIRELRNRATNIISKIPNFDGREDFISMLIDYNKIMETLGENEGVVYHLKDSFGFIKNKEYVQGIYFSIADIEYDIRLGDIVSFDNIYQTPRGAIVNKLTLIKRFFD